MTPRERDIVACLVDTVVAPAAPLPPVRGTDAVESFDRWLQAGPRANRVAIRALLLALGAARLRRRSPDERLAMLRRAPRDLVEPLRAIAAMSYYGDEGVSRMLTGGRDRAAGAKPTSAVGADPAPPTGGPAERRGGARHERVVRG